MTRALVFSTVALLLAVGGHVAGGGALPAPSVMLVGVLLGAPVAALLVRRPRSTATLALGLGLQQVVLHGLFMTAAAAGSALVDAAPAGGMPMVHASQLHMGSAMSHGASDWSAPMLLGHGVAVVLAALLLARGESLALRLRHLLSPVRTLQPVAPTPMPALVVRAGVLLGSLERRSREAVRRRGPPVVVNPLLLRGTH